MIELPHTAGCLVCGHANPHGLKLHLHVDPSGGAVTVDFIPQIEHIGFHGIVHGGVLATIFDEAMVWAATWAGRRFCVAGEMNTRFRQIARIGEPLRFTARVEQSRARLVTTVANARSFDGQLIAEASGKFVPMPIEKHQAVLATLVDDPSTAAAAAYLRA